MLRVIFVSVIMLCVILLGDVMLSAIIPKVVAANLGISNLGSTSMATGKWRQFQSDIYTCDFRVRFCIAILTIKFHTQPSLYIT
jgi:hypothetical protein